jgi:hypothetical protein
MAPSVSELKYVWDQWAAADHDLGGRAARSECATVDAPRGSWDGRRKLSE